MKIHTSNDQALVSCCPCDPPTCEGPRQECQSLAAAAILYGWNKPEDYPWVGLDLMFYKTKRWAQEGGHWSQYSWNSILEVTLGGKVISEEREQTATTGGVENYTPYSNTYSDGVTRLSLYEEAHSLALAALTWDDEEMAKGDSCHAVKWTWSGIANVVGHEYTETFVRYRIGVPEGFSTTEAPRSTYEAQWDEVFFPAEWLDWKALKDAYDQAVAIHDEWEHADPETRGEEPDVPDDPGAAPTPAPSLVASRSWNWGGSMESPWSGWFDLTPPEGGGDTRIVNMMVKCYKCARVGVKPTAIGEIHELGD